MDYFVYMMQSQKNFKIYVGKTSRNPVVRVKEHNDGTDEWSSQNKPFKLIYYEKYLCEKDAANRESFYKTGFGKSIKKIIVEYIIKNNIRPLSLVG